MPILSFVKKRLSSKSQSCTFPTLIMEDGLIGPKCGRHSIADKIAELNRKSEANWRNGIRTEAIDAVDLTHNENTRKSTNNKVTNLDKCREDKSSRDSEYGRKSRKQTDVFVNPVISNAVADKKSSKPQQGSLNSTQNSGNGKSYSSESSHKSVGKKSYLGSREDVSRYPIAVNGDKVVVRFIARNDNETFTEFFSSMATGGKFRVDEASFQAVQASTSQRVLLGSRRNLKLNRNHLNARNPVKSLAKRIAATGQYYSEVQP